jgi:hypothetical protein
MEDDIRTTLAGLAKILASQYTVNANVWASIHGVVAALREYDPSLQLPMEKQIEKEKAAYLQQNAYILRLIEQIAEQTKP